MGLGREDEYLTTGLWDATTQYMTDRGIRETPNQMALYLEEDGTWDRSYFYTNFEIGYIPFFRSEAYQSYFEHLDKQGGFYYYRWGDAPIRLLGVSINSEVDKVKRFDTIPYSHKVYVVLPEG
eukprot:CAMPEP_0184328282 /NCGR_PEP_ID=MMETSP1049-20130417/143540_1 /TAXON_ID=77928 /ORGANISM="Proteomonas sulcata, Strain CCMP704" /LENGTH=122 /DNA_ID=CAMNT_0026650585 /DNA_START=1 /DNA_END=369 /DNA_ORIENTATION=+